MGKDVVAVEQRLEKVVTKEFKVDVHHWLILHGRYVCTARKPKCGSCIIEDLCEHSPTKEKVKLIKFIFQYVVNQFKYMLFIRTDVLKAIIRTFSEY